MNSKFENISIFQLDNHNEKNENDNNGANLLNVPLAQRLKPSSLQDYVGQEHILSEEKLLYRAIKSDRLTSIILYGPPGTGKTSLAQVIANTTKSNFIELNAVTSGLKDLREVIDVASTNLIMKAEKTIVFIDEIHRFNKSQQDALLPHVEKGTIILIGATTENPFFEVNKALLSRSMMFKLEPLSENNIKKIIYIALNDKKLGYGNIKINLSEEALSFICENSNGDARRALNALELGVLTTAKNNEGIINIDLKIIEECMQKKYITYDKNGDSHYDVISAFIKSMRGSDADAAIHYLARMLYAGEDPEFIARRVLIAASEDVGNADPYALLIANAALNAVKTLGMPEARITLAQAVTYISTAPKSNASYVAINKALEDVEKKRIAQVPIHLRDKSYNGSSSLGNGVDYKYPHSFQEHYVKQQYMPEELIDTVYYNPTGLGYEKRIKERIINLNKVK
ncbi:replication-associated recombination protein A [Clostridium sp. UBA4548]|uniref:replication-associated recombination protein A n=1 Tax=Clostridium sp. UBA4548 TaxID=1946361 RepID=UPI0025B80FC8|nr:replication-associated recombination protein A [Clostridium sp. UBA4548]